MEALEKILGKVMRRHQMEPEDARLEKTSE